MHLYFVRHAPTEANLVGRMINGYSCANIIYDKEKNSDIVDAWNSKVGIYIPNEARKVIISSPARRCIQTANLLFGTLPRSLERSLEEFDCSGLGDKKFWEVSKAEFDSLVNMPTEKMAQKVHKIREMTRNVQELFKCTSCVLITHGMVIRYLYSYFTGNPHVSAYDVINSNNVKFANLDLMKVDSCTGKVELHYFNPPINHVENTNVNQ